LSFFLLKNERKRRKKKSLSPSGKTTKKARAEALEAEKQGLKALFGLRAQALLSRLSISGFYACSTQLEW
jgi:hypothetical protein